MVNQEKSRLLPAQEAAFLGLSLNSVKLTVRLSAERVFSPAAVGLAPEQLDLSASGLPTRAVFTIQSTRASSARSLYDCKWKVFEKWCDINEHFPFQWPVGMILSLLQDH